MMDPTIIKLTTFATAALAVLGTYSILSDVLLRKKARIRDRFRDELGVGGQDSMHRSEIFKDLEHFQSDTARRAPEFWKRFAIMLAQSGLNIAPERIVQLTATITIVGIVLTFALPRLWFVGLGVISIGLIGPVAYVSRMRRLRVHTLCMQLPEAFELMSRAVRAGQTMSGAMALIGTQLKPPLSEEFATCCEHQNLGLPQDVALEELARRTGVMELQLFVVAMLVHRTAGGNPVEILDNLSEVIRKRVRLVGKARAATSEGRLQAVVLTVLPIGAFAALFILNRSYAQILIDRPYLIAAVLVSELVGGLWIRRIVNFDF
jgi:tight adherence protein B